MDKIIYLLNEMNLDLICGPGRFKSSLNFSRCLTAVLAGLLLMIGGAINTFAASGDADPTFSAGVFDAGVVLQMARQPDGKVIVAGSFAAVDGIARNRIARLNADGSLDPTFNSPPEIINAVAALALQTDGKILIGGYLLLGINSGGFQTTPNLGRLNTDGSLDTSFIPDYANSNVLSIQPLTGGKILVGGSFTQFGPFAPLPTKDRLVRINADGSLDNSFVADFPGPLLSSIDVTAIAIRSDGKIIAGGNFSGSLTKLNADGSPDTPFNAGGSGVSLSGGLFSAAIIYSLAVQPDDKIVIGGFFDSYNGTTRRGVARVNADGSLDTSFNGPGVPQGEVVAVVLQPDGKVLVGGDDHANTNPNGYFKRFNTDGSLDALFDNNTGFSSSVFAIALQPDGKILAGGQFTRKITEGHIALARVNTDGTADSSYTAGAFVVGAVRKIAFQSDNKILIGGDFTAVNGIPRAHIARLNADGSLDMTFNTAIFDTNGTVRAIYVLPDGKILVGGNFQFNPVVRLNTDGSLDTTFTVGGVINHAVWDIARQTDGQIIVAGDFSSGVMRLNADGSFSDQTFFSNIGFTGSEGGARSVLLQPDGKIVLAGSFTVFKHVTRPGLERLNSDGTPDSTFSPGLPAGVNESIALQTDGKIIVGGQDRNVNNKRVAMFRVNVDGTLDNSFDTTTWLDLGILGSADVTQVSALSNGQILFGGGFIVNSSNDGTERQHVYRVFADGSPDNAFVSMPDGHTTLSFAMQPNGKLIVGGQFMNYSGQQRLGAVRLIGDTTAAEVSVSGRVLTSDGRGLRNADVAITDSHGVSRSAITNSLGNYQFDDVKAGETYIIGVSSKRYRFGQRVVQVFDTLTNVDFVGDE